MWRQERVTDRHAFCTKELTTYGSLPKRDEVGRENGKGQERQNGEDSITISGGWMTSVYLSESPVYVGDIALLFRHSHQGTKVRKSDGKKLTEKVHQDVPNAPSLLW